MAESDMTVDFQVLFNIAVGLAGFLGGWLLNVMWESIKDMQSSDKDLADKVSKIEVLVAGQYVPRSEYQGFQQDITKALRRIEDKLDAKVDK